MNKVIKIVVIAIALCLSIIILLMNLFLKTTIANDLLETVSINYYGLTNLLLTLIIAYGLYQLSKTLNKYVLKAGIQRAIIAVLLIVYFAVQVVWIQYRNLNPTGDQKTAYQSAIYLYNGEYEKLNESQYFELNPQQRCLTAGIYIIFKVLHTTDYKVIEVVNALCNTFTMLGLILILKLLAKRYQVNKVLLLILSFTFATIPMLCTFIYGDIPGIMCTIYAVYFIMKYCMDNKKRYLFISSIFMMFGYIFRTNNLIFIIAIWIYLIMDMIDKKNEYVKRIGLLIAFIIIAMLPNTLIQKAFENAFNLNGENSFPVSGYLYMGMSEGYKGNGWYNDDAALAWDDIERAKEEYPQRIKERTVYYIQNPIYTIKFYAKKVASMWAENSYGAFWYNLSFNFGNVVEGKATEEERASYVAVDELLLNQSEKLHMYQKALIILIFAGTIYTIIKNRKHLSNECILLMTIFIGGFLFEILWEAKSRYILPYIVILIPIASIEFYKKNELGERK